MSDIFDYSTHIESDEGDDSSFQCSSISSSSYSSYSSSKDIYSLETREDSFLENMYQFVRECLSNQDLISKLNPKQKSLKLKKKQFSIEENKQQQISSKFIKKPTYQSQIQKKFSFIEVVIANKFQICFILISIIMIILRTQDINNIQKEKKLQGCIFNESQRHPQCIDRVILEQKNRSFFSNLVTIIFDYHQLFYITITLISAIMLVKNISQQYSIKSFADYQNKYKQIHNLNSHQKVKLSELKSEINQKQSQQFNNNQLNNNKINNNCNIFGVSFSLNMLFSNKQKDIKSN